MRKILFGLLLFSFIYALGCKSTTTGSGDEGARAARDDLKTISITITADTTTGKPKIEVSPETLPLMYLVDKVHFVVYNNLQQEIKTVDIDFGIKAPFDDNQRVFTIKSVPVGGSISRDTGVTKKINGIKETDKYTVRGALADGTQIDQLDPQVEISGGRIK